MSILEEICSNFCFDCNKSYLFSCSLDLQMWMHADQRQTGFLGRQSFIMLSDLWQWHSVKGN